MSASLTELDAARDADVAVLHPADPQGPEQADQLRHHRALKDLNQQARVWMEEVNRRVHATTRELRRSRFIISTFYWRGIGW